MSKKQAAELPKTLLPREVERISEEQSFMEIITYEDAITKEQCAKLIAYVPEVDKVHIFQADEQEHMWVFELILKLNSNANDHVFTFDIDHISGVMVMVYEEGDDLELTSSIGPGVLGNRKLTTYAPLSDSEGGDLKITSAPDDVVYDVGSVAIFPAFMPHRVTKVTKGRKYVLWAWVGGKRRFK